MNEDKIEQYRTERAIADDGSLRVKLSYINNYPIHHYLPEPVWNIYRKIICSVGPECVICMATRWALIGFILGKLT